MPASSLHSSRFLQTLYETCNSKHVLSNSFSSYKHTYGTFDPNVMNRTFYTLLDTLEN